MPPPSTLRLPMPKEKGIKFKRFPLFAICYLPRSVCVWLFLSSLKTKFTFRVHEKASEILAVSGVLCLAPEYLSKYMLNVLHQIFGGDGVRKYLFQFTINLIDVVRFIRSWRCLYCREFEAIEIIAELI